MVTFIQAMRWLCLAICFLSWVVLSFQQGNTPSTIDTKLKEIPQITDDNCDDFFELHPSVFFMIYTDWCTYCEQVAPQLPDLQKRLAERNVAVAKMKGDQPNLMKRFGQSNTFPVFVFYHHGEVHIFPLTMERTAIMFEDFVLATQAPVFKQLSSAEEIDSFIKSHNRSTMIGFFRDASSSEYKRLAQFAQEARARLFSAVVVSNDDRLFARYEVAPPMAVALHEGFTSRFPPSNSAQWTHRQLSAWIDQATRPIVGEITPFNWAKYADLQLPMLVVWLDTNDHGTRDVLLAALHAIGRTYHASMLTLYCDGPTYWTAQRQFGLSGNAQWPALSLMAPAPATRAGWARYPVENETLTEEGMREHVNAFFAGKLQPHVFKVAAPPQEENERAPVYTLVHDNFYDVVKDPTRDVLVLFYTKRSGMSMELMPGYERLAEKYRSKRDKVLIAKFEAEENELPTTPLTTTWSLTAVPTVMLFRADNKLSPEVFAAVKFTQEGVENFLLQNASVRLVEGEEEEQGDEAPKRSGKNKDEL